MLIFLPDTLKVTESTILTPKSYEHPRQVNYGSPTPPPRVQNLQKKFGYLYNFWSF